MYVFELFQSDRWLLSRFVMAEFLSCFFNSEWVVLILTRFDESETKNMAAVPFYSIGYLNVFLLFESLTSRKRCCWADVGASASARARGLRGCRVVVARLCFA